MSFNDLWQALVRKRPPLANESITIEMTPANLRKLCEQMYDQGVKAERKAAETAQKFREMFDGNGGPFGM